MLSFNSYYTPGEGSSNCNNDNNGSNNNTPVAPSNNTGNNGSNAVLNAEAAASANNGTKEMNFEPNKTLFLGDLSYFCSEDNIFELFSPYGPINTIKVQRGVSGEPLLHGYIVFNSPMSAKQALLEIDGIHFMGRKLRIQLGTIHHHNKEKLGFSDSKNFTQIHVSFICKRAKGFVVNEQVLRDIFSPFGEIADVAIKKHSKNPKQQRQTGYGFIYFVSAEDACRAVIALKNSTLHDITFDCNISHKSEHLIRSMLDPVPHYHPSNQHHHHGGRHSHNNNNNNYQQQNNTGNFQQNNNQSYEQLQMTMGGGAGQTYPYAPLQAGTFSSASSSPRALIAGGNGLNYPLLDDTSSSLLGQQQVGQLQLLRGDFISPRGFPPRGGVGSGTIDGLYSPTASSAFGLQTTDFAAQLQQPFSYGFPTVGDSSSAFIGNSFAQQPGLMYPAAYHEELSSLSSANNRSLTAIPSSDPTLTGIPAVSSLENLSNHSNSNPSNSNILSIGNPANVVLTGNMSGVSLDAFVNNIGVPSPPLSNSSTTHGDPSLESTPFGKDLASFDLMIGRGNSKNNNEIGVVGGDVQGGSGLTFDHNHFHNQYYIDSNFITTADEKRATEREGEEEVREERVGSGRFPTTSSATLTSLDDTTSNNTGLTTNENSNHNEGEGVKNGLPGLEYSFAGLSIPDKTSSSTTEEQSLKEA